MTRDDAPRLRDRLRADPRVPVVTRAFLGQRLGLVGDDLELLDDDVVVRFLALPGSVTLGLGAVRLLERLDALVARAHPVDLSYRSTDVTVARVAVDDGDVEVTAALQLDGVEPWVTLEVDDREVVTLDVGDTEALAYALLRLVRLARGEGS